MTDPQDPHAYRPQPYPYPGPPPAPPGAPRFTDRMGARLARRPEARFGPSLAAAGMALVIVGILVWSIGYLVTGLHLNFVFEGDNPPSASGDSRRFLGAFLCLALVLVGYALVIGVRRGPLATAGVVATVVGLPLCLTFFTLDINGTFLGQFPVSIDAIYLISILVYAASYFVVPGAQGRSVYLGLVAVDLAAYIGFKAAGNSTVAKVSSSVSGNGLHTSGLDTIAAIGLVLGILYYLIAFLLDRSGRAGAATGLVYAGFVTIVSGIVSAIPSFHQDGTGILLIVLGAALAWYGGRFGRRFTAWVWSAVFVIGVAVILEKIVPHSYTGAGITAILIGAIVIAVAALFSTAIGEAPDLEEEPVLAAPPAAMP